jgi:hypothetical protein
MSPFRGWSTSSQEGKFVRHEFLRLSTLLGLPAAIDVRRLAS